MIVTEIARKYLGETEKPRNSGFNDAVFEAKMAAVGFVSGHAWCAYFAELVFKEAFPQMSRELNMLFSAGTVQTYRNFLMAGYPTSLKPKVDDLVIWQSYRDGKALSTGHAGIVSRADLDGWHFRSIEGNTSDEKSREGYIVAEHERSVLATVRNGLKVLGFVTIRPK